MRMWAYEAMMNANGFKEKNLIYDIYHPSQFEQISLFKRIVVRRRLEIDETH
jgi:hypothetical protein